MDREKYFNNFRTFTISLAVILVISLILLAISSDRTLFIFNDRLFATSVVASCIGFIISITSKSRRHYYLHLKKKFSGKNIDPIEYENDEARRHRYTQFGIALGLSGVTGIVTSAIIAYL